MNRLIRNAQSQLAAALLLIGLAAPRGFAGPLLSIGVGTGSAGGTVAVPVSLSGAASAVAAQFEVAFDPTKLSVGTPSVAPSVPGHLVFGQPTNGTVRVVIYSLANAPITNGVLINLPFTVAAKAGSGRFALELRNGMLADANAARLAPVQLASGSITVVASGAPSLSSLARSTSGLVTFLLTGTSEQNYVIQASTNLVNWVPVSTNVTLGGTAQVTDSSAGAFRARFYRALLGP